MAILGGALLPLVQGRIMDTAGAAAGFIVPAVPPRDLLRCSTCARVRAAVRW